MGWRWSRGSNLVTGPLVVRWRASPTGASTSSFASSSYKSGWRLAGGAARCVRPIGRCRRCKYKPRQRVLHPVQLLEFSRPAHAPEAPEIQPSFSIFSWRGAPEWARTILSLAGYLIPRKLRVTNRCPGSAGRVDPLPQLPKLNLGS
jgi:hypothetical protein